MKLDTNFGVTRYNGEDILFYTQGGTFAASAWIKGDEEYQQVLGRRFEAFTADDGKEYLNVRVSSCGNTEIMNNARTEVEKWIKSLDYEPDDYEIKVPEFCDGEARVP